MKFWDNVGVPSCFRMTLSDCLWRVSSRRHSPLSPKVVKNQTNIKAFGHQFLWDGRPGLFYCRLLARFTVHLLTKFGWVTFA